MGLLLRQAEVEHELMVSTTPLHQRQSLVEKRDLERRRIGGEDVVVEEEEDVEEEWEGE